MMVAKIGKVFWASRNCRKLAEHLLMNFLHEILMINGMVMMARRIYVSMVLRRMVTATTLMMMWMMLRMLMTMMVAATTHVVDGEDDEEDNDGN